jgi:hypothetical protein
MTDDNITAELSEARDRKFWKEIEAGKFPALSAGYKPAEDLVKWYLVNGYGPDEMLHALAYSAAAQCFRDLSADDAEIVVMDTFMPIVSDLLRHGPHYGHEEYGGKPKPGEMEAIYAKLHAAVDRFEEFHKEMAKVAASMKTV